MEKTAFVFPGQGSQIPGMGKSLYEAFPTAKRLFELGSDILGMDLPALCFTAPEQELERTVNSQPAIYTVSLAAAALLNEGGLVPDGVCGFSLGEVPALAFAGALTQEQGFSVIAARARYMQQAADASSGGMCAIIGLTAEDVERICGETTGYVVPVNYNCPKQTVIAGEETALAAAAEACLAAGALKAVRLKVNAAFHSRLMEEAADKLAAELAGLTFAPPRLKMYSCLTAGRTELRTQPAAYMREQMVSPVRFETVIRTMIADGYTRFIEVGTGTVLSGLIRRISRDVTVTSCGDAESVRKLLA